MRGTNRRTENITPMAPMAVWRLRQATTACRKAVRRTAARTGRANCVKSAGVVAFECGTACVRYAALAASPRQYGSSHRGGGQDGDSAVLGGEVYGSWKPSGFTGRALHARF